VSDSGDRARRPGGRPEGGRPDNGRPARGGPADDRGPRSGDGSPRRNGDGAPRRPSGDGAERGGPARSSDRPARSSDRPARSSDRPARSGDRPFRAGGKPGADRGGYQGRTPEEREERDPFGIKAVRNRHDDPVLPDDVQPKELDKVARAQLKTLSKENADEVARHLAMVARLISEKPELAHQHAVSAARRAGRIAVVRETLAITAYMIGDFSLALREFRTYRRISGRDDQLPMMVDSERGLGRPDRALELGRSVPRSTLPVEVQVELAIAMSGARLDLEQKDAALIELEIPQLDASKAFSYSPALFDAYATVLEELGRDDEAERWWELSERASDALDSRGLSEDDETIEVVEEELDDQFVESDDSTAEAANSDDDTTAATPEGRAADEGSDVPTTKQGEDDD
jgi:hypothetical protein